MEGRKISAVAIKELYYGDVITDEEFTGAKLHALINGEKKPQAVENVHGDTFKYEEAEPNVTKYKNALSGKNYRQDKEDGDAQISFTIGEYSYQTKADLQGGKATATSWKRENPSPDIFKSLIGKTKDGVYVVFPRAAISARGSDTDKAVGLAVSGVAMDTGVDGLASEYWFDESEVTTPAG